MGEGLIDGESARLMAELIGVGTEVSGDAREELVGKRMMAGLIRHMRTRYSLL